MRFHQLSQWVFVLLGLLLIQGCNYPNLINNVYTANQFDSITGYDVIQDIDEYESAIDLAQNGTKDLSAFLDNLLYTRPEKLEVVDDVHIYTTDFYAKRDAVGVIESFRVYCEYILHGDYHQTLSRDFMFGSEQSNICTKKSELETGYFYLNVTEWNSNIDKPRTQVKVIEPTQGISQTPITIAHAEWLKWQ